METWSCEYCPGRTFSTEAGLAAHLNSVHADEENNTAMKPDQKD